MKSHAAIAMVVQDQGCALTLASYKSVILAARGFVFTSVRRECLAFFELPAASAILLLITPETEMSWLATLH